MTSRAEPRTGWTSLLGRGTLGRRLLVWFLVLSLVPLLVSNTLGYLVSQRILRGQVERYLGAFAEIQAAHVAHEIDRQAQGLRAMIASHREFSEDLMAAVAAFRAGLPLGPPAVPLNELLGHELAETPAFDEFFVLGPGGYAIAATDSRRLGLDWSQTRVFQAVRTDAVSMVEWETKHTVTQPVFFLAIPILDDAGTRRGVFAAATHFENHRSFLRIPPHLAGNVETYVVSGDGRPLFVSHAHLPVDFSEPLPSRAIHLPPGSTVGYVNYEGVEVIGSSARIPGTTWLCIAEAPLQATFGDLRRLRALSAVLEGVFALGLVAIVWLVARSIVSPLRLLVAGAEAVRAGDLSVRVEVEREDEVGQLGRTFNAMAGELERSTEEIQELHADQMRRAAQLASVGELASGLAHEIKNPAAAIASGLDLLTSHSIERSQSGSILSQTRAHLRRIQAAIDDLLSYARPREPRLMQVDPAQIVERTVTLIEPQAEAVGVRVTWSSGGTAARIEVDPEQLTQVLVNLALNGIQAMEEGGELSITACERGEEVRIEVADSGIGVEADRLQEIFRPFVTSKHTGTGLGLAITRGIVERHGGRVEVESRVGEGSRFTVVLPASPSGVSS